MNCSLRTAIAAVVILLLAVLLVYPQFMPRPPTVDPTLFEPVVVPEPIPEPPIPIPEPPIPDTPTPPPLPPTQPSQEKPGGAVGQCENGVCSPGLFPRLRARRGR